jgi:hypothetical protein
MKVPSEEPSHRSFQSTVVVTRFIKVAHRHAFNVSQFQSSDHSLRENFTDSEDTNPRRSHPEVFYIDVNSIPLSIVENLQSTRDCGE